MLFINNLKLKSEFSKNVLTLIVGTGAAQVIPIVVSPILTRLYSPNDFGVFALYLAFVSIFAIIATARYEFSIMLPLKDNDALQILYLTLTVVILSVLFLNFIAFIFYEKIIVLFQNSEIAYWIYLIPFGVIALSFNQILNYWYNRKKLYYKLAYSRFLQSICIASISFLMGIFKLGFIGLLLGSLIGQLVSVLFLLIKLKFVKPKKIKIIYFAKRYIRFPKFNILGSLLNTIPVQLIYFLVPIFYNFSILGYYSLAQKILNLPLLILSNSVGQVFMKEAIREKEISGKADKIFSCTARKLFFYSIVPFGVLYLFIKPFFGLVFGDSWAMAGEYAQILIIPVFIQFIISPLSISFLIFEKNLLDLIWQFCFFILNLLSFLIAMMFDFDFSEFLVIYSCSTSIMYLSNFWLSYKICKREI